MRCVKCGQILEEDMEYCPACGYRNNIDPYKGYWKKPILWIILLVLAIIAAGAYYYISVTPVSLGPSKNTTTNTETIKIEGNMNEIMISSNNQASGYSVIDDEYIYYVYQYQLMKAPLDDLEDTEVFIDDCQGYLQIVDDKMYYCDFYYDYYVYDFETEETTMLLENIYYPVVVDNKVYYQMDSDNESLHCLDLLTMEDLKFNDVVTYVITVDGEKIYYIENVDSDYSLHRMDLNGENDELIYEYDSFIGYTLDEDYIYVSDDDEIIKINKDDLNEEVIDDNTVGGYLNIIDDQLVVLSDYSKIQLISKDGENKEVLYSGMISSFVVVGDNIVVNGYNDEYETELYVVDLDGNSYQLSSEELVEV